MESARGETACELRSGVFGFKIIMANQRVAFFVEGVRTAARLAITKADDLPAAAQSEVLIARQTLLSLAQDLEVVAATFERMQGGWDAAVIDPVTAVHVTV